MKTINATATTETAKDDLWDRVAKQLAKANIKTSRWERWVRSVHNYWVTEWWHNTNGVVAKTVKLAHDTFDYVTYNTTAWLGGFALVCILF